MQRRLSILKNESVLKRIGRLFLRALPLLGLCGAAVWLWQSGEKLSVDTVLSYTPARPLLAALFLLLLYGLKSISLMLPVLLLDTVCGVIFPLPAAILVATLGTDSDIRAKLLTLGGVLQYMDMYSLNPGSLDVSVPGYCTYTPN